MTMVESINLVSLMIFIFWVFNTPMTNSFVFQTSTSFANQNYQRSLTTSLGDANAGQLEHGVQGADSLSTHTYIPEKIAKSLDLPPLIEAIAKHTATKRGHDALLSVLQESDQNIPKQRIELRNLPKRNPVATSAAFGTAPSRSSRDDYFYQDWYRSRDTNHIMKLSQSSTETQFEWTLVQEAMSIIAAQKGGMDILPPIYAENMTPLDGGSNIVDTDDDEWLIDILSMRNNDSLELEDVLKADQVLKRILKTHSWASHNETKTLAPTIANLFNDIDMAPLIEVHEEIKNTVVIVKGHRSFQDPTGTKSYSFELDPSRFPVLSLLKEKMDQMYDHIDTIMNDLMSTPKYLSKITALGGKKETFLWEGRIVVAVQSKEDANKMGIIRGNSQNMYFVEPKEIIPFGNDITGIQNELNMMSNQILNHFNTILRRTAKKVNDNLDLVARIDVILARATFGTLLNGQIPEIHHAYEGEIMVKDFVHPILALNQENTVPIDLMISQEFDQRSLIITGPNFGGKTVAMKSFGLVAIMNKLAIPIPTSYNDKQEAIRIDYFHHIFVEIGDNQSVLSGESTYSKQLRALSTITNTLSKMNATKCEASLILLDELGSGTDAEAGGFIGQAFLEKILVNKQSVTICTTHSSQLRELSMVNDRFLAATVLLRHSDTGKDLKLPSYTLTYGIAGFSNALNAAERIPELPDDVLMRAKSLISSSSTRATDERIAKMLDSLERKRGEANLALETAQQYEEESLRCRQAVVQMARAYYDHFSTIETRLDNLYIELRDHEEKENLEVVGETLSTLRFVQAKIKTVEERLKEMGLRLVEERDEFNGGEQVSIVEEGNLTGEVAIVSFNQDNTKDDELRVELDLYLMGFLSVESNDGSRAMENSFTVKRRNLAVWNYREDSLWDERYTNPSSSVPETKKSLVQTLHSLSISKNKSDINTSTNGKKFTSSRERKAASKKKKKK